ncbi:hypothetical protein MP638_003289 [Amoeboaphelidium occidentale]|nr:hypothetical protein MP638_003289 [Amoeboaphelidium occidentale]
MDVDQINEYFNNLLKISLSNPKEEVEFKQELENVAKFPSSPLLFQKLVDLLQLVEVEHKRLILRFITSFMTNYLDASCLMEKHTKFFMTTIHELILSTDCLLEECLDCLDSLLAVCPSSDNSDETALYEFLLDKIAVSKSLLPLLKFLLHSPLRNQNQEHIYDSIIKRLRPLKMKENITDDIIVLLNSECKFNFTFRQCYLKRLSVEKELKLVDFIMVLSLYEDCGSLVRRKTENVVLNRLELESENASQSAMIAKADVITLPLQNQLIASMFYQSILRICDYISFTVKKEHSFDLLQCVYSNLFSSVDLVFKVEIISILITHLSSTSARERKGYLSLIYSLLNNNPSATSRSSSHFFNIVKQVIDFIEVFDEKELEIVYELLISLSMKEQSMDSEVLILLKKQVSNPLYSYKKMGIIGYIKYIQFLCKRSEDNEQAAIGSSQGKSSALFSKVKDCLENVYEKCLGSVECLRLFYSQLSVLILDLRGDGVSPIAKFVLDFLYDFIGSKFQELFVKSHSSEEDQIAGLDLFADTDGDEEGVGYSIMLYSALENSDSGVCSLYLLECLFKLMAISEMECNAGSVEGIDGLLPAGVEVCQRDNVLKCIKKQFDLTGNKNDKDDDDLLEDIEYGTKCFICFAYASVWFIELISTFSLHSEYSQLCWMRVGSLIQSMQAIKEIVSDLSLDISVLERVFPCVNQVRQVVLEAKGKMAPQNGKNMETEDIDPRSCPLKYSDVEPFILSRINLRFFNLLRSFIACKELKFSHTQDVLESLECNFDSAVFVLDMLYAKLRYKLCPKFNMPLVAKRRSLDPKSISDTELDALSPAAFISTLENDGVIEGLVGLYKYTLINGTWEKAKKFEVITKCLICFKLIASASSPVFFKSLTDGPLVGWIEESFNHELFKSSIKNLYMLIDVFEKYPWSQSDLLKVQTLYQKLLNNEGYDDTRYVNTDILECLLDRSEDMNSLQKMSNYIEVVFPALISNSEDADDSLSSHLFLNKDTFQVYFKCILSNLARMIKDPSVYERLDHIAEATNVFAGLLKLLKQFHTKQILVHALKFGRFFIEGFTKHALTRLDVSFKHSHKEVTDIIKLFQSGTRVLQSVCSESKDYNDKTLNGLVPVMKKNLEAFVVAVRKIMVRNNVKDAFWLGTLKNKSLSGTVLSSQIVRDENTEPKQPARKRKRQKKMLEAVAEEDSVEGDPEQVLSATLVQSSENND